MPELPEVHTTSTILNKLLKGLSIRNVWSDYGGVIHKGKKNIKDAGYFSAFKKGLKGRQILSVARRGKNVLIHISQEKTIIIHMKMTGHLLYGKYEKTSRKNGGKTETSWKPISPQGLKDPYNRFIRLAFELSNGKYLALSDARRFAKVAFENTVRLNHHPDLEKLGPEPNDRKFSFTRFKGCLQKKPAGRVKLVLMDQEIISGIGNIYSDEILWRAGVHPEERVKNIPDRTLKKIYRTMKLILRKGMVLGGDSTSDYRNPHGLRGSFHYHHKAYRRTGNRCGKKGCGGIILRKIVGARSAHFCDRHQKLS